MKLHKIQLLFCFMMETTLKSTNICIRSMDTWIDLSNYHIIIGCPDSHFSFSFKVQRGFSWPKITFLCQYYIFIHCYLGNFHNLVCEINYRWTFEIIN